MDGKLSEALRDLFNEVVRVLRIDRAVAGSNSPPSLLTPSTVTGPMESGMIEMEVHFRVVCDVCGYPYDFSETRSGARETAREGGHGVRKLHETSTADVCHNCTDEGKAEIAAWREKMVERYGPLPEAT